MPSVKRKRGGTNEVNEHDEAALLRKVSGKLHHSFKEVAKASKKAKTFEIQRAVKKLREGRAKGAGEADIRALDVKLKLLKDLDHTTLAHISLARKIQKIKALSNHPAIRPALDGMKVPSLDAIQNDSKQILLSSKILAGEVEKLCTALKNLIEPPAATANGETESESEGTGGEEEEWKGAALESGSEDEDEAEDPTSDDSQPDPSTLQSALSKLGIKLDALEPAAAVPSESEDLDSIVPDDEDDEAGDGVDDQASWESGSVDSDGNIRHAGSISSSDSSASPPTKRSKAKPSSEHSGAGSRFLPSLATGFIRGDGSDVEDADAGSTRKNRRGQRARKAIWEKKYGKNANHVKKAREAAMAARGRGRGRGRGGGPGRGDYRTDARGENAGPGAPRGRGGRVRPPPVELPNTQDGGWAQRAAKKAEEKPMHPSWIAKQKLKAKESLSAVPAQGKKIVFN